MVTTNFQAVFKGNPAKAKRTPVKNTRTPINGSVKIAEAELERLRDSDDAPEALSVRSLRRCRGKRHLKWDALSWPLESKI